MYLTASSLIAYFVTTLVVMVTPGITVTSLLGTTLSLGTRTGMTMEIGVNLARLSMLVALWLGLSAITAFMIEAYQVVKIAGAAYLIWLGIKAIRHPPDLSAVKPASPGLGSMVLRGFAVVWSNPKAFLFFGALLPQFIVTEAPLVPQLLLLGVIWIGTATVTDSIYIVLSGRVRTLFSAKAEQMLGWVSGTVLIGAALWLAMSQKA